MRNEDDIPALVPLDDTNPSSGRLFRKTEELDDKQFALLASAWAEEGLDPQSLEELESLFDMSPEKRLYAEGFKKTRLKPLDDTWAGKRSLLKPNPLSTTIRRSLIITLSAAAVFIFLLNIKGILKSSDPVIPASTTEFTIARSNPIQQPDLRAATSDNIKAEAKVTVTEEPTKTATDPLPEDTGESHAVESLIALNTMPGIVRVVDGMDVQPVQVAMPGIFPVNAPVEEDELWMIRGVNAIASLFSRKEQDITGYKIANSCVKGVNAILGWEMQLNQVLSTEGQPVAVSFNSSLISFESNVKKNNHGL